jgi:hypothetical protein
MAGAKIAGGLGFVTGQTLVSGLLGIKGAVQNAIASSVAKWAPKALRGVQAVNAGARIDPLRTRLDGTVDEGKKSRRDLMRARSEEIRRAAPAIRDSSYKVVEPIVGQHPEFSAALHEAAVRQFDALSARLPRDPGTAVSRMRSAWQPDAMSVEKFSRYYEVFQNPIAVAVRAVSSGQITAEAARALREVSPEIFQQVRVGMLERLAEPGNLDKLNYHEQISLGQMLSITIHSTQEPRFIAAQQQMFKERNEPLTTRPPGGSASTNPSGGRPPGASAAQAITEH